jgi:serine/threonine-protein kinase RsbW
MRRRARRITWTSTWLHHRGLATVESVTRLRRELSNWLYSMGVSTNIAYDLVLSCYEAMANVVAHAYPPGTTGFLDLDARLGTDDIAVTVRDRGHWKAGSDQSTGGRGLALIQRLSDSVDLVRGADGTTVDMRWHRHEG